MLASRCVSSVVARKSIDYQVLIIIAASIALGTAVEKTGLADQAANILIGLSGDHTIAALAMTYLIAMLFTSILSNTAAAVVLFPIAMATAASLDANPKTFAITLMIGATASFLTPISYQTNLMVYGPGGYRYADFLRIGAPLSLFVFALAMLIVPRVWPI